MWDPGKQTWLLPINLRLMTEETEVSEHKVFDKDAVDSKKAQPVRTSCHQSLTILASFIGLIWKRHTNITTTSSTWLPASFTSIVSLLWSSV